MTNMLGKTLTLTLTLTLALTKAGPMINMLDKNNPAVQKLVLDALANLLSAGEELGKAKGENEFTRAFDEAEGVDKLEGLQEHKNADIYDKVRALGMSDTA